MQVDAKSPLSFVERGFRRGVDVDSGGIYS